MNLYPAVAGKGHNWWIRQDVKAFWQPVGKSTHRDGNFLRFWHRSGRGEVPRRRVSVNIWGPVGKQNGQVVVLIKSYSVILINHCGGATGDLSSLMSPPLFDYAFMIVRRPNLFSRAATIPGLMIL